MEAILWDGNKQLNGQIELKETHLAFTMSDFAQTNLNFEIAYADIAKINHSKVYNIARGGVEIMCRDGRRNVFVVGDVTGFRDKVQSSLKMEF